MRSPRRHRPKPVLRHLSVALALLFAAGFLELTFLPLSPLLLFYRGFLDLIETLEADQIFDLLPRIDMLRTA
jgi:hypothetical protein